MSAKDVARQEYSAYYISYLSEKGWLRFVHENDVGELSLTSCPHEATLYMLRERVDRIRWDLIKSLAPPRPPRNYDYEDSDDDPVEQPYSRAFDQLCERIEVRGTSTSNRNVRAGEGGINWNADVKAEIVAQRAKQEGSR